MNENHKPLDPELRLLEDELHAMLPVEPSDGLRSRLRHALLAADEINSPAPLPVAPVARPWFGWFPLAAAAAVAMLSVVMFPAKPSATSNQLAAAPSPATSAANPHFEALSSRSQLQQVNYEGIRQEDSAAYRQIRSHFLDSRIYKDSTDGATVEWHVPREEVWLVPVSIE